MEQSVVFPSGLVKYFFQSSFEALWETYDKTQVVIITDENIARPYGKLFKGINTITLPPGEHSKDLNTIRKLTEQLLEMQVTRKHIIIGVGGGVVTDTAGFIASIYMRGVRFGFVPTTLLGMTDAAIGGKNGIDAGMNKNILGVIRQPEFILYDTTFLDTLPDDEWSNGFAEIIKYGCIFDNEMLGELERHGISYYKDEDDAALGKLIERCAAWKNKTVAEDEQETGVRKLLNFGHTAAHAIENLYELPHGKAVAVGMVIACLISEAVTRLPAQMTQRLKQLLKQYHLPVQMNIDAAKVMDILRMDKKRSGDTIDYILLEAAGKGIVRSLSLGTIAKALTDYASNS